MSSPEKRSGSSSCDVGSTRWMDSATLAPASTVAAATIGAANSPCGATVIAGPTVAVAATLPGWTMISAGGAVARISVNEYSPEQSGHCTTASWLAASGTRTCFWHLGQFEMNAMNATPLESDVNAAPPRVGV